MAKVMLPLAIYAKRYQQISAIDNRPGKQHAATLNIPTVVDLVWRAWYFFPSHGCLRWMR
jgi:hypothetical protein